MRSECDSVCPLAAPVHIGTRARSPEWELVRLFESHTEGGQRRMRIERKTNRVGVR